jgi:hypothetical protein
MSAPRQFVGSILVDGTDQSEDALATGERHGAEAHARDDESSIA